MKTARHRRVPEGRTPPRSGDVRRGWRRAVVGACGGAVLGPLSLAAAFVYESTTEFLTSGDFNGDFIADVLVLDKATGNARVGYQNIGGALTWSAPLGTGVEHVTGAAVGRFLQTDREALAVTSPVFNRLHYVDLSATNAAVPLPEISPGLGPHTLVGLRAPFVPPSGSSEWLLVASGLNDPPAERLDVKRYLSGSSATAFASRPFQRGNALSLATDGPTFAAGLVRRADGDALHVWQFTNALPTVIAVLSNLPPGSDYVFGTFDGEPLPRFWFYVPGQSNVSIRPLLSSAGVLSFGNATVLSFNQAVRRVYYVASGGDGTAFIEFGDGIQGARLPGGTVTLGPKYSLGAGSGTTGLVPLDNGRFALLSGPGGTSTSARAQIMSFDGSAYTQLSAADLPPISRRTTRANVWLFQSEPFVTAAPGFIASLNAPDWSSAASGLPGSISVLVETDGGPAAGLGGPATINLGLPPSGAAFGLPDQYRDDISFFTYAAPRPPEPVVANIAPVPGSYGGPITVSFTTLNPQHQVQFRTGSAASWNLYAAPFLLTNDATVQYYGRQPGTGFRGPIQFATYAIGRASAPIEAPVTLPGGNTNAPPDFDTNRVVLSPYGTLFYGRRSVFSEGTIWAINLDGSGDRYITDGARPRVSSDGRYLAFLREGNPFDNQGNLWIRDLITGEERRIFSNSAGLVCYDWEYGKTNLFFDHGCNFWQAGLGGAALPLPLDIDCAADAPHFNPADGRLAFHVLSSTTASPGVYVTLPEYTGAQRLTLAAANPRWPTWSPDGRDLALVDSAFAFSLSAGKNLWIWKPDGTGGHQITGLDGANGFPHGAIWSPDGDALIGAGTVFNSSGIWIIPLSENRTVCVGEPRRLPTAPGDAIDFVGGIHVVPPPPRLFIRGETGGVTVYWRRSVIPYVLEATASLEEPAGWSGLSGPFTLAGDFLELFIPDSLLVQARFFRLRAP